VTSHFSLPGKFNISCFPSPQQHQQAQEEEEEEIVRKEKRFMGITNKFMLLWTASARFCWPKINFLIHQF